MTTRAVLYHKDCPDGFTAAWVAHRALTADGNGPPVVHPVSHSNPPPDLTGIDEVYIVDFSYPYDTLVDLTDNGRRLVTVLDHHRSAIDDITSHSSLSDAPVFKDDLDVERSGAGITWDWFHPDTPRPPLVDYVEDRDLWRFRLPDSKAVSAFIRSQPYTFEDWDRIRTLTPEAMADEGRGVLLHIDAYCRAAAVHAYWCEMGGRRFPIVNVPYESCSEVAAFLLDQFGTDVAGYYFERGEGGWQYGFRSRNGVTVHDLAAQFGGGGHEQASGCVTDQIVHRRLL